MVGYVDIKGVLLQTMGCTAEKNDGPNKILLQQIPQRKRQESGRETQTEREHRAPAINVGSTFASIDKTESTLILRHRARTYIAGRARRIMALDLSRHQKPTRGSSRPQDAVDERTSVAKES